ENQGGVLRRFWRSIPVLDDEEVEAIAEISKIVLGDPRMRGIRGDDPEPLDPTIPHPLEDLVVGIEQPTQGSEKHIAG
ncbi:MAG: hypothetical protein MKZ70_01205, partial [Opitutales bacterium]|nr:hypothetical protein [Opitutales bacterium]